MAKRRVNVRNLSIVGGVLFLLVVGGGVAYKLRHHQNPQKMMAIGKSEYAAGHWQSARDQLIGGLTVGKLRDAAGWVMAGDASARMAITDPEGLKTMGYCWRQALEIDPGNVEALRRLIDTRRVYLQFSNGKTPEAFKDLRDLADKLVAADPKNVDGQFAIQQATIDQWLNRVQTDPKKIDDAVAALKELQKTAPADGRIPEYIAKVEMFRADESQKVGETAAAKRLADEAEKTVIDALKGHEDDADLQYAVSQTERQIAFFQAALSRNTNARGNGKPDAATATVDSNALAGFRDRWKLAVQHAAKASELVKPGDDQFLEIRLNYVDAVQVGLSDPKDSRDDAIKAAVDSNQKAEAALRETVRQQPNELRARIALAQMLSRTPKTLPEAVALLNEPVSPDESWAGAKSEVFRNLKAVLLGNLADLQLDQLEAMPAVTTTAGNAAEVNAARQKLLDDAKKSFEQLKRLSSETAWRTLAIRGRLEMAQGKSVEAAQTLNGAVAAVPADTQGNDVYQLKFRLAQAFVATQQTGEAKAQLREVIGARPGLPQPHALLAELLIREKNFKGNPPTFADGAIAQIDALEKLIGADNQAVIRLRLATLDDEKDKEKAETYFAQVPETTVAQRLDKTNLALRLGRKEDAVRLLHAVLDEQPAMPQAVAALATMLMNTGDKDGAMRVVDAAIVKDPNNTSFKSMKVQIQNPQSAMSERRKLIDAEPDPVKRNLALAELAAVQNDNAGAIAALKDAEKADANNNAVMERLFLAYLANKDFASANTYLDKLAKKNVDQADGKVYRIRYAMAQGKIDDAFDQASGLTKTRPEFSQSWAMLGMTLQAKGRYDDAIGAFQQAQTRQTENVDALRGLITCYLATDRPGKRSDPATGVKATDARYYLELADRIYPDAPVFNEMEIQWELRYGDPDRVVTSRKETVDKNPQNVGAWIDLCNAYLAAGRAKNKTAAPGQLLPESKAAFVNARDTALDARKRFNDNVQVVLVFVDAELALKEFEPAEKAVLEVAGKDEFKGKPETANMLAEFYSRSNQPQKAEAALRDFLAANPASVDIELRLATLLSAQQRPDDALKVLDANTGDERVKMSRIDMLLRANRLDDATKAIDAALASKSSAPLERLRARIDLATGKFDDARQRVSTLLSKSPDDYESLYLRGLIYSTDPVHGDPKAATEDLTRVANAPPAQVVPQQQLDARVQLAAAYKRQNLDDQAIRVLESAVNSAADDAASKQLRLKLVEYYLNASPPRWLDAEKTLREARAVPQLSDDPELLNAEAIMWTARGEPSRAVPLARQAMQKLPEAPVIARTYFAALLAAKDYRTILTDTDAALKQHPLWWWLYEERGAARKRSGDSAGAIGEIKSGVATAQTSRDDSALLAIIQFAANEIGPGEAYAVLAPIVQTDSQWTVLSATLQSRAGDAAGAKVTLEKFLTLGNLPPAVKLDAQRTVTQLYMASTPPETDKAIGMFREILKAAPDDMSSLNNIAVMLLSDGPSYSPAEGLPFAKHAYDISNRGGSPDPLIADTYGWALVLSGKIADGTQILRDVVARRPFAEGYYHLGTALLKQVPPAASEAERAFLDGQKILLNAESAGAKADPAMKALLQKGLDQVKTIKH